MFWLLVAGQDAIADSRDVDSAPEEYMDSTHVQQSLVQ